MNYSQRLSFLPLHVWNIPMFPSIFQLPQHLFFLWLQELERHCNGKGCLLESMSSDKTPGYKPRCVWLFPVMASLPVALLTTFSITLQAAIREIQLKTNIALFLSSGHKLIFLMCMSCLEGFRGTVVFIWDFWIYASLLTGRKKKRHRSNCKYTSHATDAQLSLEADTRLEALSISPQKRMV